MPFGVVRPELSHVGCTALVSLPMVGLKACCLWESGSY